MTAVRLDFNGPSYRQHLARLCAGDTADDNATESPGRQAEVRDDILELVAGEVGEEFALGRHPWQARIRSTRPARGARSPSDRQSWTLLHAGGTASAEIDELELDSVVAVVHGDGGSLDDRQAAPGEVVALALADEQVGSMPDANQNETSIYELKDGERVRVYDKYSKTYRRGTFRGTTPEPPGGPLIEWDNRRGDLFVGRWEDLQRIPDELDNDEADHPHSEEADEVK